MRRHALLVPLLGLWVMASAADTVPGVSPPPAVAAPVASTTAPPAAPPAVPPAANAPVWIPGNWEWTGSQYVWRVGRWQQENQPPPPTTVWVEGRWLRDADNRWVWVPAHAESNQPGQQPPPPPMVSAASAAPQTYQGPTTPAPPPYQGQYQTQAMPQTMVVAQDPAVYQDSVVVGAPAYYGASYYGGYYGPTCYGTSYGGRSYCGSSWCGTSFRGSYCGPRFGIGLPVPFISFGGGGIHGSIGFRSGSHR
jgi:hypothetical protein